MGRTPPRVLDVRGLHCPLPVLRARLLLETMAPGEELLVQATDPASRIDIDHFCYVNGHELLAVRRTDYGYEFHIRRRAAAAAASDP